jgi:serine/threonine protein kinase
MSEKIGRFEIISQLAQSPLATVHKALDTESQQTVALKVVRLDQVKDRATLLKQTFEEADQAKPLSSHNIAALYGSGDEGDLLLAAAEYVQGNSVATTLARKDGFSIWDLQDIARQVCQALDHAHGHNVVHQSLEPAKIMVQWDGMVKVLGFGMSAMNSLAMETATIPDILHYASPEQLRDEACDHRSMLFSLGTILYEMATEQKPFTGETAEQLRTAILEQTPPLPVRLKPNVNAALSALIMKAISKSPDQRFQSGQELIHELEECKNSTKPAKPTVVPAAPKAKAFAAAAGAQPGGTQNADAPISQKPLPSAKMSTATQEPPATSHFKVDPMMAGEDDSSPAAAVRKSFSDMSELPPLKEVYVAPASPPAVDEPEAEALPHAVAKKTAREKSKIQVRETAQKAVSEIRKTPPKLYLYAIGGALALVAVIIAGMTLYNWLGDRGSGESASVASAAQSHPLPVQPPAAQQPAPPQQSQAAAPEAPPEQALQQEAAPEPAGPAATSNGRGRKSRAKSAAAIVPAQLSVSSNPAGAQISFDGSVLCDSPCTLTGIAPGQHTVLASKAGFGPASRSINLASAANSSLSLELIPQAARLSVASTPAGAVILIDGKDTGKLTPSQLSLDKPGAHTIVVRRSGYLDESGSINAEVGQTSNLNLTLKPLGSTEEIRAAGGKFKKVFGHGEDASMGIVSVKTQPKGAQIMVNSRVLDKTAPFDFYLNPGTYVLDINMSGYRGVHRVISVESKERVAIEESLVPE